MVKKDTDNRHVVPQTQTRFYTHTHTQESTCGLAEVFRQGGKTTTKGPTDTKATQSPPQSMIPARGNAEKASATLQQSQLC